ncbi:MAG: hypothetical protein HY360_12635, partial [Verrucomicrobia bacterium]|nr:hypothetical protein [Verrucomicrobiota bacterium]
MKVCQLRPVTRWTPSVGKENRLWITLRGKGLEPGEYAFDLQLAPQDASSFLLPVRVKVWPVTLPDQPRLNLEMEHCLPLLPVCDYHAPLDVRVLRAYTDNLAEHGANFAIFYPLTGEVWNFIRIKSTGQPLAEAVRKDQSFLDRDPLPNLDFSYFNPWLD